jgi:glycosyltransferase involved in cell wall biosynthesis
MVAPLNALVVAYNFPPVGGAGVQRMSKLVKYLPSHGVAPSVLTVANPSVPLRDASLSTDLSADVEVVRARTLEPGYAVKAAAWSEAASPATAKRRAFRALSTAAKAVLVPDPQVLWLPAAGIALLARLQRRRDDVVLVSGPPFSQFLLASLLRARRGIGIVLDYRDEWSTYRTSYEMTAGRIARHAGDLLEPVLLRCAHRVTTATEEFREELLRRHRFLSPSHVVTIPNGYDTADFPSPLPDPPTDRFVLTYAGTLFRLTSARGLLGAIRRLHAHEPELAKLLRVRFLGRIVDTERHHFEGTEALGVSTHGYVAHDEVLASLAASHMTLCLLDDVPGTQRIYPAKIFELMHLGRPILTLAPDGALTRLARRHELGDVVMPRDEAAIAEALARRLRAFRDAPPEERAVRSSPRGAADYDRRALAGRFATVLRDAASDARERRAS